MEPSIERAEEAVALGTYRAVVVMVWRGTTRPTGANLSAATDLVRRHAAARRAKVAVISIVEDGTPMPARAEREALKREMHEVSDRLAAAVFVAEGAGAWTQLAFDTVNAIDAFRGKPLREKLCTSVGEAVSWTAARLAEVLPGDGVTRDDLHAAIATIRAHATLR